MIRGKLVNAFTTSKSKFLANAEVAAIITLIGGGYGRDFDINKVKWDKIICLADADADGAHISTLLLRFFLLYMPGLIESGKLYRAVPPLYGIKAGSKTKYFASTLNYMKYVQAQFNKQYTLEDMKGVKISPNIASSIFYQNRNYTKDMEVTSSTFAIDADLLESVLYEIAPYIEIGSSDLACNMAAAKKAAPAKKKATVTKKKTATVKSTEKKIVTKDDEDEAPEVLLPVSEESVLGNIHYYFKPTFDFKKFAKNLKKQYKFLEVKKVNNEILIEGLVNSRYQYIFLTDKFIRSCVDLIMMIKNNDPFYKINGNMVTMYGLMKTYEGMAPSQVTRYKGLGEQNDVQLRDSVLYPENRTLIQYTIESAKKEIESIRYMESNMAALLRDLKVDRQDIE